MTLQLAALKSMLSLSSHTSYVACLVWDIKQAMPANHAMAGTVFLTQISTAICVPWTVQRQAAASKRMDVLQLGSCQSSAVEAIQRS